VSVLPAMTGGPGEPLRVLILGLAGGTIARQISHYYGGSRALAIDGVELDPTVLEAGRRHFGLGEIRGLAVHVSDARPSSSRREDPTT
jgi:spermidine synthase